MIGSTFDESCDVGMLRVCLSEIMEQIGHKVDYVFISGTSDDWIISMHTEYHGGTYTKKILITETNCDTMSNRYIFRKLRNEFFKLLNINVIIIPDSINVVLNVSLSF